MPSTLEEGILEMDDLARLQRDGFNTLGVAIDGAALCHASGLWRRLASRGLVASHDSPRVGGTYDRVLLVWVPAGVGVTVHGGGRITLSCLRGPRMEASFDSNEECERLIDALLALVAPR